MALFRLLVLNISRQHLGIMDIFQQHFCRHDIVAHRVYRQMQLAPDSPRLSAVFSDLPLAFARYLEASRVDNQVGDTSLTGLPIGHCHLEGSLADTVLLSRGMAMAQRRCSAIRISYLGQGGHGKQTHRGNLVMYIFHSAVADVIPLLHAVNARIVSSG